MNLLDQFAIQILNGMLSNPDNGFTGEGSVKQAYKLALKMCEERNQIDIMDEFSRQLTVYYRRGEVGLRNDQFEEEPMKIEMYIEHIHHHDSALGVAVELRSAVHKGDGQIEPSRMQMRLDSSKYDHFCKLMISQTPLIFECKEWQ